MTDIIQDYEARVNVTYGGENGDLPDPVNFEASDADVKAWVTEAVRNGNIPGIPADPDADFSDFVVDRYSANETRPYRLFQIRPKTPFGLDIMTVGRLIEELKNFDPSTIVVLSGDSEGNRFRPLPDEGFHAVGTYHAENSRWGAFLDEDEDPEDTSDGVPCIVLWPA